MYFCIFKSKYFLLMKNYNALLLFLLLFVAHAGAQHTFTFATRPAAHPDSAACDLKMDVYQPAQPRGDGACVVYVFGGGFVVGARDDSASVKACRALADKGFVVASIDYRLYLPHAPKVSLLKAYTLFDTAITWAVEDCSDAIRYLCSHAGELHIDTSRIVLTGSSAGAITVLQTDYCRCNALPAAAALPQGFRPAAVLTYSGGIFCRNGKLHYAVPPAPTALFHGTSDRIVSYKRFRGSLAYSMNGAATVVKEFKKRGYSHWILRYEGRGHEVSSALCSTLEEFCAFVDATFRGRHMAYDATCTDGDIRVSRWTNMTLLQMYGM